MHADAQRSVCRLSCDAENQREDGLTCVDPEAANRAREKIQHETKSSPNRDRAWNGTEWEIKSSGRQNGLSDEAEWGMRSDQRRGVNAIGQMKEALEQQKRVGEIGRMKPERSIGNQGPYFTGLSLIQSVVRHELSKIRTPVRYKLSLRATLA
jgi:hypothetical protein